MKRPFMRLWVGDLLASWRVESMTTEAFGAYMLVLCRMWQDEHGRIRNDRTTLARAARLSDTDWPRVEGQVMPMLTVSDCGNWLTSDRQQSEIEHHQRRSESARRSASKRWQGRPKDDPSAVRTHSGGNASQNQNQNQNQNQKDIDPVEVYEANFRAEWMPVWQKLPGRRRTKQADFAREWAAARLRGAYPDQMADAILKYYESPAAASDYSVSAAGFIRRDMYLDDPEAWTDHEETKNDWGIE